jgi:hypothetical protein
MPSTREYVKPLIEKAFFEMKSRIVEIERETVNRDKIAEAICNYAGNYLAAESMSLVASLYKILSEETFGKDPFLSARNRNKFRGKNIKSMIFNKYSFQAQGKINYTEVNANLAAIPIPAAEAGLGIVLSIALSKAIIVPVSLVIAAGLYFFLREKTKYSNTDNFVSAINSYLETLKRELMIWLENIESFYHEQVAEVIKTLED